MQELMNDVEYLWETGNSMDEIAEKLKVDEELVEECVDVIYALRYPESVVWH